VQNFLEFGLSAPQLEQTLTARDLTRNPQAASIPPPDN
jgi:hypothetical protein